MPNNTRRRGRDQSAEILDEHDVAVLLVCLLVENPSAVRRNTQSGGSPGRLFLESADLCGPARPKAEEFDGGMRLSISIYKTDALVEDTPVTPIPCARVIENRGFLATFHRNFPNAGSRQALRVVEKLTVGRFKACEASLPRYLNRLASFGRDFPDLPASGLIGSKEDPAPVSRPTRHGVIRGVAGDAARWASFCLNHENVCMTFRAGIESDLLAIWRPARRAGEGTAKRS